MLGDEKYKIGPMDLKIATDSKFDTRNPKIRVPNAKNQPLTTSTLHPSKIINQGSSTISI